MLNERQQHRLCQTLLSLAQTHWPADKYMPLALEFDEAYGQLVVRFIVEGRGFRVSLDECAKLSQSIETPLEAVPELMAQPYSLEVSSPGLFRAITTEREAAFYHGKPVACWVASTVAPVQPDQPRVPCPQATAKLPLQQGTLVGFRAIPPNTLTWQLTDEAGTTHTLSTADYPNLQVTLAPKVVWPQNEEADDHNATTDNDNNAET